MSPLVLTHGHCFQTLSANNHFYPAGKILRVTKRNFSRMLKSCRKNQKVQMSRKKVA